MTAKRENKIKFIYVQKDSLKELGEIWFENKAINRKVLFLPL